MTFSAWGGNKERKVRKGAAGHGRGRRVATCRERRGELTSTSWGREVGVGGQFGSLAGWVSERAPNPTRTHAERKRKGETRCLLLSCMAGLLRHVNYMGV